MESKTYQQYNVIQFSDWDRCSECHTNKAEDVCQYCWDIICLNNECSISFPHKNNGIFSLCLTCKERISNKFQIVEREDYPELRLLKNKIKKKLERKIKQYE